MCVNRRVSKNGLRSSLRESMKQQQSTIALPQAVATKLEIEEEKSDKNSIQDQHYDTVLNT